MKIYLSAVLALLIVLPVSAASPKKAKQKTRSLKALIEITMSTGDSRNLGTNNVEELKYGPEFLTDGDVKTKFVFYHHSITPDHRKHYFSVGYKADRESGKEIPTTLIWDVAKGWKEGEVLMIDDYEMRISLDGKLERIISIKGPVYNEVHTPIDVASNEARSVFEAERLFYTRDSIGLKLSVRDIVGVKLSTK